MRNKSIQDERTIKLPKLEFEKSSKQKRHMRIKHDMRVGEAISGEFHLQPVNYEPKENPRKKLKKEKPTEISALEEEKVDFHKDFDISIEAKDVENAKPTKKLTARQRRKY